MSEMEAWWEERKLGEKVVLVILFAIGGAGLMFLFGRIGGSGSSSGSKSDRRRKKELRRYLREECGTDDAGPDEGQAGGGEPTADQAERESR